MKRVNLCAAMLIFVSCIHSISAAQVAAQRAAITTPVPVTVTNTGKNPVPTAAQGTTTVSGSVSVTNNPLAVSGNVNVANTPLPVTGTVIAGNLPLNANGDVLVSVVPDTTQYQFQSIVAVQLVSGCSNGYGADFCTYNGSQWVPIEQTLTTLSAQGYDLFSIVPAGNYQGLNEPAVLYTLRAPVPGNKSRRRAPTSER